MFHSSTMLRLSAKCRSDSAVGPLARYCVRFLTQRVPRPAFVPFFVPCGVCSLGACAAPACDDGLANGYETDVDCGGPCPACGPGQVCGVAGNCSTGICAEGTCASPDCTDGLWNGQEA